MSVKDLEENDIVFQIKNGSINKVVIKKIRVLKKKMTTYNLSNVKNNHNFFANDILVHNKI